MPLKISLLALFLSFAIVNANPTEDFYFIKRNICNKTKTITNKNHNNLIQLECDWPKFVHSLDDTNRYYLDKPLPTAIQNIYEIIFTNKFLSSNNLSKYKTIGKNTFKNFKIRTLTMKDLDIETIDEDAFEKKSFYDNCETIDLSGNRLKRIDSKTLRYLNRLETLNLARNQLSLESGNFKHSPNLILLDLSSNQLQFLTVNLLENVKHLKTINLSDNNLRSIHPCALIDMQTNLISKKYAPASIDLTRNPLECDCALFYLNRVNNFGVEAMCHQPIHYRSRTFKNLSREDPSLTCGYDEMKSKCDVIQQQLSGVYTPYFLATVFLSVISLVLCCATCCCCCKVVSLSDRVDGMKSALRRAQGMARQATGSQAPVYVDARLDDRQKLIKF